MGAFDHWHPVLLSEDLKDKPVGVKLHGQEIVLFRTADGSVGALEDFCLHRRMRLSCGWVEGERVVCSYHGWSYDRAGELCSPSSPKVKGCARRYDVTERHGALWISAIGSGAKFPEIQHDNMDVFALQNRFTTPLEIVLDNFTELEHAGTTHLMLGFDRARMSEVEVEMETTEDTIRMVTRGPQRKLPRLLELAFGVRSDDRFVDTWTHYFSPIYAVYDHQWINPQTNEIRRRGMVNYIFFVPVSKEETHLFSFIVLPPNLRPLFLLKRVVKLISNYEMELDSRMLSGLADTSTSLHGMKLGRFDRPLGETRKRIQRIYYGKTQLAQAAE